jgi:hypothetical protein
LQVAIRAELIATLDAIPMPDRYGPAPTIHAKKSWTPDSEATVLYGERSVGAVAAPGLVYLLEVDLAQEAIEVWSEWRDGQTTILAEAVGAVIWYAEHDAYEPIDADTE